MSKNCDHFGRRWSGIVLCCGAARVLLALMLLAVGGGVGVGQEQGQGQGQGYTVVATVAMIGDVAREIARDRATVVSLVRSGVDPHLYTPTRSDVQQLQRADVVLYVGSLLEGRMSTVLDALSRRNPHIHALIDAVSAGTVDIHLRRAFMNDPHIWMDVQLWRSAAEHISRALTKYDPAGRDAYRRELHRYIEQLDRLHAYAQQAIQSIPARQRLLVTAHDAFAYFGRAYGVRVEGIQGISTESEAGVRRINGLIDLVIERDVGVIFIESSVNDRNVRSLIEGARARGHRLRIGGVLYSDAMGGEGSYEGSYIGMIDHNATTIATTLGGEAPRRGMQGRLRGEQRVK